MNNPKECVYIALCLCAVIGCADLYGQAHPERRYIRSGNRDYEKQDYVASEEKYRTAAEKNPASYEAQFNLGDALYKQGRFEESEKTFAALTENTQMSREQSAKVFYNQGNAQFSQQKLKEAVDSYKNSLRMNPNDLEVKYNLAYAQKLLEQQQEENNDKGKDKNKQDNQNDKDNKNDKDKQNNKDSEDKENGGQQDKKDNDEHGDDDGQDNQNNQNTPNTQDKPSPSESQPSAGGLNKDDAAKMLETIQAQEDKTREKVNDKKKAVVGRSGKNW